MRENLHSFSIKNGFGAASPLCCRRIIRLSLFLVLLGSVSVFSQQPAEPVDDEAVLIDTGLVSTNVSVTDRNGKSIPGLDRRDFNLFVDGREREIDFFGALNSPASVSIVFDSSGSMSEEKLAKAQAALAGFIGTTSGTDEFFLVNFNDKPVLRMDRGIDETEALKRLTKITPQGNTALYDAVELGLERVEKGRFAKKILLIISDGIDNNSRTGYRNLRRKIQESGVFIYAVGFESKIFASRTKMSGTEILEELTDIAGGKTYTPENNNELDEIFEKISLEIRNIYSVGFYVEDRAETRRQQLKVKIKLPDASKSVVIRSRQSFRIAGADHKKDR